MRYFVFALLFAATSLQAAQRVYEGEEASAIRCANMMAMTGVTLNGAGLMGVPEKDVLIGISVLILERHVGGTWAQKKAAMAVMRDRRSVTDTLDDYRKNAARCLLQFPIN